MTIQKSKLNIEDIKVGETYNILVKVKHIDEDGWYEVRTSVGAVAFVISPEEAQTLSPLPKYDPKRLFRKGDKVQVKKRDGRCNGKAGEYLREAFCTVAEDETQNELVRVLHNATEHRLDPAYLELVTPVEELEPYSVGGSIDGCILYKNGEHYAEFVNSIDAERACKLLNAEHRKEQGK